MQLTICLLLSFVAAVVATIRDTPARALGANSESRARVKRNLRGEMRVCCANSRVEPLQSTSTELNLEPSLRYLEPRFHPPATANPACSVLEGARKKSKVSDASE
ncbi:hypothetical protein B0H13DRAFT_1917009 [Mycena leptocephala]|nr:hypothetical protein B0H13DRAFT_1917009 [Mycena leptocephala]